MKRRLLNLLTALSLPLCLAVCVLWPYSYFALDAVGFWPSPAERWAYGLFSHRGTVCVLIVGGEGDGASRWMWRHEPGGTGGEIPGTAGFVLQRERNKLFIGVPYWTLCLLLAAPPVLWVRRRRRRRDPGLCPSCGYDLRATPERCPECGTERGAPAAVSAA